MPSDNKYNPIRRKGADYLSYKDKVIKDALDHCKFKPKPLTAEQDLIRRAQDVTEALRNHVKPILQAGGGFDVESLRATVMTMYCQAFDEAFSKDELVQINAVLHTDIFMETVEANPGGKDKPDLLSGL